VPETKPGGVVLLHGIGNHSGIMRRMALALEAEGYATLNVSYPSLTKPLVAIADGLAPRVCQFADSCDGPIHFVGHSLGGLVIRAYLARNRPANLGRVVMLGTPNLGSELAEFARRLRINRLLLGPVGRHLVTRRMDADEAQLGMVDYPLGIIAGDRPAQPHIFAPFFNAPNDGKVTVERTRIAGVTDHLTLPLAHQALPKHLHVIQQTIAFLRNGRFDASDRLSN